MTEAFVMSLYTKHIQRHDLTNKKTMTKTKTKTLKERLVRLVNIETFAQQSYEETKDLTKTILAMFFLQAV